MIRFQPAFPQMFYNLQKLKRKNINGRRHYITPEGNVYPSVTSVLKILDEEGLDEWRKRVGEGVADHISRKATTIGTKFHKAVEIYLTNLDPEFDNLLVKAHFENLKPLLHNINLIKSLECHVYSDVLQLAGQLDCVAVYKDVPSIIDFKTASKKKKEEWIERYFLQSTAYSIMWDELTGEKIEQIVILISGEDGSKEEYIKNRNDYVNRLQEILKAYKENEPK